MLLDTFALVWAVISGCPRKHNRSNCEDSAIGYVRYSVPKQTNDTALLNDGVRAHS